MAITDFSRCSFGYQGSRPPLAEGMELRATGIDVAVAQDLTTTPIPEEEQTNLSTYAFGPPGNGPPLGGSTELQEVGTGPSEAQGCATKRPFLPLPWDIIESICGRLGLEDKKALSMSCKFFSTHFHELYRRRCRVLLASDDEAQLFGRLGIPCPAHESPSHAQMEAMVGRVAAILESTREALENFPETSLPGYTAEALALRLHPGCLRGVLGTAYCCSLYKFFERCAPLRLPSARSLGDATKRIRAWLDTSEALGVLGMSVKLRDQEGRESFGGPGSIVAYHMAWAALEPQGFCHAQAETPPAPQGTQQALDPEEPEATGRPRAGMRGAYTAPLSCFPDELGRLKNLRWLSLAHEELVAALPAGLGQLTNLQELLLDLNGLERLPAELAQLTNLRKLQVSAYHLERLPPELWQLTNLQELALALNGHIQLPAELGQLVNLKGLWVAQQGYWGQDVSRVRTFPAEILTLQGLETLALTSHFALSMLPRGFGQLKHLKALKLAAGLPELPSEIWQLDGLEVLEAQGNGLEELPPEVGQLTSLKELNLNGSRLRSIPKTLGYVTNLKKLDLSCNQLKSVPKALGRLRNLEELDLSGNRLRTIPEEFGQLVRLKVLDVSCNRLEGIPKELGQLADLREIDLNYNRLRSVPRGLGRLPELERLGLQGNSQLRDLSPELLCLDPTPYSSGGQVDDASDSCTSSEGDSDASQR